ncbi:terminase small subunit [Lysinibacillus sp. NPDC047702]|uniref:terminase small subunit n=1 Tax=unclassified Lysinibacillus TaxID=2636778 RepID=UPI003D072307
MARARDPRRDQAYDIYKAHNGDIKLKDIAEQLSVSEGTVRGWKNKDKWDERLEAESNGTFQSKQPKNTERSVKKKPKRSNVKSEAESQATVQFEIVQSDGLNDRQLLFCMHYVRYWNATKAYQKAYECDYRTAHANAHRMMANDGIKTEIERLKKNIADGLMLSAEAILQKYIDIAFADITDFIDFTQVTAEATETTVEFNPDGSKKSEKIEVVPYTYTKFSMHHSDEIDGTLITELSKGKDGMFKVKLSDKMAALAVLAKCTNMLDDRTLARLQQEKLKADAAFARERAAQLKGKEKDTSLLQSFIDGQKQFNDMAASGAFSQFTKGGGIDGEND